VTNIFQLKIYNYEIYKNETYKNVTIFVRYIWVKVKKIGVFRDFSDKWR